MIVDAQTVQAIAAAGGTVVAVLAGMGGMLAWFGRRLDRRLDNVQHGLEKVAAELVEVKISVARLEGPRPGLHLPGTR